MRKKGSMEWETEKGAEEERGTKQMVLAVVEAPTREHRGGGCGKKFLMGFKKKNSSERKKEKGELHE